MLRYSVIFFVALVMCYGMPTQETKEKWMKYHEECEKSSGYNAETFKKDLKNGSDDKKLKEHALCIVKKSGALDNNGKLDEDALKKQFEEAFGEYSHELTEKCIKEEDEPLETAFFISKCISEIVKDEKH